MGIMQTLNLFVHNVTVVVKHVLVQQKPVQLAQLHISNRIAQQHRLLCVYKYVL
jgi:hypothetical protein